MNGDLGAFHRCVAAVIARFPFCEDGGEERSQQVADELRDPVAALDDTALAQFRETMCDHVEMGDYATRAHEPGELREGRQEGSADGKHSEHGRIE